MVPYIKFLLLVVLEKMENKNFMVAKETVNAELKVSRKLLTISGKVLG